MNVEHNENTEVDTVHLELQGRILSCNRLDLVNNSDYFKAMFEGNFMESVKTTVKLNEVDFDAMNTILRLLWDREYIIKTELLLPVLQTCCMLQFLEVKDICVRTLLDALSVENCLKIWFCAEKFQVKPLCLKAKLFALMNFMEARNSQSFLELELNECCCYLGSVDLQVNDEMIVFYSVLKWFDNSVEKTTTVLVKLLSCINFHSLTRNQISVIAHPHLGANRMVLNYLLCLIKMKYGEEIGDFDEDCVWTAKLLLNAQSRNYCGSPCILVNNVINDEERRNEGVSVVHFDTASGRKAEIQKLLGLKCLYLDGFAIVGWHQFIYVFGGEFLMGRGDWNSFVWEYDLIKSEIWRKKQAMPYPRRHFEKCICNDYLYIIGGTGPYRVIQENMFWYSLKENKWGQQIALPCSGRQIKCCNYNNQLFVLNINIKCGFLYNHELSRWTVYVIYDKHNELPSYSLKFAVFSYKSNLFIKDKYIFELEFKDEQFVIINKRLLADINCYRMDSILCHNILYSLYKQMCEETNKESVVVEAYNLDTYEVIFDKSVSTQLDEMDGDSSKIIPSLAIFNVHHYNLIKENDLINTNFVQFD